MIRSEYLEELLSSGSEEINPNIKPNWLLTPFGDNLWKLRATKATTKLGASKKYTKMEWDTSLATGALLKVGHRTVLRQMKLLCLAHVESPVASCNRPQDLPQLYIALLNIAEFLSYLYPNELKKYGIAGFGSGRISEYLDVYAKFGAVGTSFFRERWDAYFKELYSNSSLVKDTEKWVNSLDESKKNDIRNLKRTYIDLDEVRQVEHNDDPSFLKFSRSWLFKNDKYDSRGCISSGTFFSLAAPDRSSRTSQLHHVKEHLKKYELCCDYRHLNFSSSTLREKIGHKDRLHKERCDEGVSSFTLVNRYRQIVNLINYCNYIPELKGTPLASAKLTGSHSSAPLCRPGKRTRTIPTETALFIYENLIRWVTHYSEDILQYSEEIIRKVLSIQGNVIQYGLLKNSFNGRGAKLPDDGWEMAFKQIEIPNRLKGLNIRSVYSLINSDNRKKLRSSSGSSRISEMLRSKMNIIDMININCSVIALLMSALCLKRNTEVIGLKRGAILGSKYPNNMTVYSDIAKIQIDGIRAASEKPVPSVLGRVISKYEKFSTSVLDMVGDVDSFVKDKMFIVPSLNGISAMSPTTYYHYLDIFCDFIEVPENEMGKRWYIRPHECRRFLALSFFWMSGKGKSLPALAWWMGHSDIRSTWRYIREELTGQEVTEAEASFACDAIRQANGISGNCEKLSEIVCTHFSVTDVSIVNSEDLKSYLELLHDEGRYTISPVGFDSRDGGVVEMVIVVKECKGGEII